MLDSKETMSHAKSTGLTMATMIRTNACANRYSDNEAIVPLTIEAPCP